MKIIPIIAQSALNKLNKRGLPYQYDLNLYRGCVHNCAYCYARKSYKYIKKEENFANTIHYKTNIVEKLEHEFKRNDYSKEIINIGGVCDSYQYIERDLKLMPDILNLFIKHKVPCIISTKSDLILRDIELIDKLAHYTYVNIAFSITSNNEAVSKIVEPYAAMPKNRINAITEISKTKASTGFHFFPILPYLSDSDDCLEYMVKSASESKATYMMCALLYLTGSGRVNYMKMIEEKYPNLLQKYLSLYKKGSANKEYKTIIHNKLKKLRTKYNVSSNYKPNLNII